MKSNNFFIFENITVFIVLTLAILTIPILFISGNEVAAIILILIFGFVSLFVFILYNQLRQEDEDLEDEDKDIDGAWYSNHYMKQIYEAYGIKNEEKLENNKDEDDEESVEENDIFKVQGIKITSPISETFKSVEPISTHLEDFGAEEIETKIKFYKTLRTFSFIVLVIVAGVYTYLQKEYPNLGNKTTFFYAIISVIIIIRLILIYLEVKLKKD